MDEDEGVGVEGVEDEAEEEGNNAKDRRSKDSNSKCKAKDKDKCKGNKSKGKRSELKDSSHKEKEVTKTFLPLQLFLGSPSKNLVCIPQHGCPLHQSNVDAAGASGHEEAPSKVQDTKVPVRSVGAESEFFYDVDEQVCEYTISALLSCYSVSASRRVLCLI